MGTYKIGSKGEEVIRIQERLGSLKLYNGPVDGIFGGGTAAAVKLFQQRENLVADGTVGPRTWLRLLGGEVPQPAEELECSR